MTTVAFPPAVPTPAPAPASIQTLADLMERLGGVPLERIRFHPAPGTALEQDVLEAEKQGLLCELVDGVLVEKAMGYTESILAAFLIEMLNAFVRPRNLGFVSPGRDHASLPRSGPHPRRGLRRLGPTSRRPPADGADPADRPGPGGRGLSQSNTPCEMARKRHDYFTAGVRLVWLADPRARTVDVYTSESQFTRLTDADVLDGGDALPGFRLPVRDWFAELDRQR